MHFFRQPENKTLTKQRKSIIIARFPVSFLLKGNVFKQLILLMELSYVRGRKNWR
jgi:hypothetical protein